MQVFFIVFYQELLLFSRNLGKIFANLLFFLISVTIFLLLAQGQEGQGSAAFYSVTIIWFSLLSCLIFSSAEFLKRDFEDGTIEQILTSCDNFEVFILAKMLANWFICALPILFATLPICSLAGLDFAASKDFLSLIFFATLAINFIGTFCGSLSALGNSAPMIAVIALPLTIPIVLLACGGFGSDSDSSLKIIAGLSVFLGSISVFATARIVRIVAE